MKLRIIVDRDACQSIATCVATAPELYTLDGEAKAIIIQTKGKKSNPNKMTYELEVEEKIAHRAVLGAEACPFLAIEAYNADNGQKLFPKGE